MPARIETARTSDIPKCRGVYLLSHPRSASNLFQKMLAKQPGFQNSSYKLFDAGFASLASLQKGRLSDWSAQDREALYDNFRKGFEDLQDEIEDAESNGKQALIKEHAMLLQGPDKMFEWLYKDDHVEPLVLQARDYSKSAHTNPTSLPDYFLLSLQPVFQIRHPGLMFPSMYRAQLQVMENTSTSHPRLYCCLTLRHSRALYDWYLENAKDRKPRVVDADDVMSDRAAIRQLCLDTGLDPDAIQYEWESREEKADPVKARFLSTINASTGILKGLDSRDLNLKTEKAKWVAEFGEEVAEQIAKYVDDAMPDYEYLLNQRRNSKIAVT